MAGDIGDFFLFAFYRPFGFFYGFLRVSQCIVLPVPARHGRLSVTFVVQRLAVGGFYIVKIPLQSVVKGCLLFSEAVLQDFQTFAG